MESKPLLLAHSHGQACLQPAIRLMAWLRVAALGRVVRRGFEATLVGGAPLSSPKNRWRHQPPCCGIRFEGAAEGERARAERVGMLPEERTPLLLYSSARCAAGCWRPIVADYMDNASFAGVAATHDARGGGDGAEPASQLWWA